MTRDLRNLIKDLAISAEQLAASSEELTASAEQSAQASNQVAGSIVEVAEGADIQLQAANKAKMIMESLSSGIKEIADNTITIVQTEKVNSCPTRRKCNYGCENQMTCMKICKILPG